MTTKHDHQPGRPPRVVAEACDTTTRPYSIRLTAEERATLSANATADTPAAVLVRRALVAAGLI